MTGPSSRGGCVVHLVRGGNPLAWFERFLRSYRRHEAGAEHRLVILCKGFASRSQLTPVLDALDGLPSELLQVGDEGFDLTAYRTAAARLEGDWLCFLNSSSEILAAGWLETLRSALRPHVGLAGATGSWSSSCSLARYHLRLPSAYRPIFPDHEMFHALNQALEDSGSDSADPSRPGGQLLRLGRDAAHMLHAQLAFPPFPAPHVRTNAFAIRTSLMRELVMPQLRTKARAWRMESGWRSVTRQVLGRGFDVRLVGRDGLAYEWRDWPASETFWQADQANLLVADNQTEKYCRAGLAGRGLLAGMAWGPAGRPEATRGPHPGSGEPASP